MKVETFGNALSWIWGQPMPSTGKLLLLALLSQADDDLTVTGVSQDDLAEWCCVTKKTVTTNLAALERHGLLTRTRPKSSRSGQMPNTYQLHARV